MAVGWPNPRQHSSHVGPEGWRVSLGKLATELATVEDLVIARG
jgi:hypothetical protein